MFARGRQKRARSRCEVSASSQLCCKCSMKSISSMERRKTNRWWLSTSRQAVDLGEITSLTAGLSPQAKLAQGTPAHLETAQLRARFLFHQRHVAVKGKNFFVQPFDRHLLDQDILVVDLEELLGGIDHKRDVLSSQSLLDVIGLFVDIGTAIRTDATSKSVPMNALQPTIGVD